MRESKKLNVYQRRYLLERIQSLRYRGDFKGPKEPAAVKQARKVADGWDRHVTALRLSYERKRSEKFAEARKLLNFGTPAEALAAVEVLESLS